MSQSFTPAGPLATFTSKRQRVLVTGAAGSIGRVFSKRSAEKYDLRLMTYARDKPERVEALEAFGEVVEGDICDLGSIKSACDGVDAVLHLAGNPKPTATWEELLNANIIGTYNTFAAAKAAGCRRVVYASSIHAVGGYPDDVQIKVADPVNPGDLYGVSKCFAEALARYMATQENLSILCVRIGAFQPDRAIAEKPDAGLIDSYVSHRDLTQLFHRCLDVENLQFGLFHGLSGGRFKKLDITAARDLLGYAPEDDFAANSPVTRDLKLNETVLTHRHGRDAKESGLREEL